MAMQHASTGTVGVIFFNLGAPESPDSTQPYIARLLSDPDMVPLSWPARQILASVVSRRRAVAVASRYQAIGGSPLMSQSRLQAEALQRALAGAPVAVAFRHSEPSSAHAFDELAVSGARKAIAVPVYPQWSQSTSGSAARDLARASRRTGVELRICPSFPDAPGFVRALLDLAVPLLTPGSHLVFCAHGLPVRSLAKDDPYLDEVTRTVRAMAARLPPGVGWSLAFQGRVGRMRWTGPELRAEIARLARSGARSLVVSPISFVSENLETLYELDVEAAAFAKESGIAAFRRAPAPQCHPAFIGELARIVRRTAREAGWEVGNGS